MTKLLVLLCLVLAAVACSGPAATPEPTGLPPAAPTVTQAEEQPAAAPTAAPTAAEPTPQPAQDSTAPATAAKDAAPAAAPPGSLIRLDAPAQHFSLSDAQRTLPEGILREIGFYVAGGGGGEDCSAFEEPGVKDHTATVEWRESARVVVCGFEPEEPVTIRFLSPQGETMLEEVVPANSTRDVTGSFRPELNDPLGTYTALFSGASGSTEQTFEVALPNGPRVYQHDGLIVLFQFQPHETIRLYAYEPLARSDSDLYREGTPDLYAFSLWNEFVTDAEGQLIIEGFPGSVYDVIGELSGEPGIPSTLGAFPQITSHYPVSVMLPTDEEMSQVVDLWTLIPFHDLDQPGEQKSEVTVSATDPLYWRMRWCAVDRDVLKENLSRLRMYFLVNGQYIETIHLRKTEETHPNTGWACHRWGTLLKDFPVEEPTVLEISYELLEDVNDGEQVYSAGVYRQLITVQATGAPAAAGDDTGDDTGGQAALPGEPYAPPRAEYVWFEPTADNPPPDDVKAIVGQLPPLGLVSDESETGNGPLIAAGSPTTLEPAPSLGPEFWLDLYVLTCAWPVASEYAVTIEYPDGRTELDRLNVDRSATCEPYTTSLFDPLLGTYTIQFGTYENMRHSIEVVAPSGPRLYVFHEGNQGSTSLLLHHFAPNEAVHLYEYKPDEQAPGTLRLAGWQALQTDDNGQLLVGTRHCLSEICMSQPGAYIPTFVVVGDTSGEVHEFDQLSYRAAVGESILIEE